MDQLMIVVPLGLLLLCIILPLLRFGDTAAARYWVAAWGLLYVDGIFSGFSLESMASLFVAQVLGLGFAVGTFLGARALNDHTTPRWVPVALVVAGVVAMLFGSAAGYASVSSSVGLIQGAVLVAGALSIGRGAKRSAPLEWWLAGVLLALALNEMFDFLLIAEGNRLLGLGIWVTLGLSTAILQVGVLADRARQREIVASRDLDSERAGLLDMLDAVPVGILLEDGAGYIRLLNPPLAKQLGVRDPDRWAGRHSSELLRNVYENFAPESAKLFDHVRDAIPVDVPREFELRLESPRSRTVAVSVLPIDPRKGRSRGRVWVSRDVTDERRVAQTLQEAERMETVGTLAGGLAHDFNNQLTAILGNATLLRNALPDDARSQRRADDLVSSAEHCAELTAGLLAFARRGPTAEDAVDVRRVFADAVRLLQPSLDPGVHLVVDVRDDTSPVAADSSELRRVVTNLLLNARDAVGSAGRIRLAARPHPDALGRVELTVEDDGGGMSESVQRHLFDPFFTTKEGGTGLGLSIVYGIVQAHGAEIGVRSAVEEGAVFRVSWPAARSAVGRESRPIREYRSRPATVLLAEDEAGVRRLMRQILEGGGYRVIEASDGGMAMRLFDENAGEIGGALLDLSMPNATGLEALAAMRERAPGLPAVIMSGHPTREGTGEWPADVELVKKPCAPDVVLAAVGRALAGAVADVTDVAEVAMTGS